MLNLELAISTAQHLPTELTVSLAIKLNYIFKCPRLVALMHSKKIKPRNGPRANCCDKIHNRKRPFFSVSALGKSTILLVKNAILSEQCGIVSQVGGNKMEIVTS